MQGTRLPFQKGRSCARARTGSYPNAGTILTHGWPGRARDVLGAPSSGCGEAEAWRKRRLETRRRERPDQFLGQSLPSLPCLERVELPGAKGSADLRGPGPQWEILKGRLPANWQ